MISINKDLCIGCGQCLRDCAGSLITLQDGKAHIDQECMQCGHCLAICPVNAVTVSDYDMGDVEEYNKDTFHVDPQTLLRTMKFRRSIRNYTEQPIEPEKLSLLLSAGRYAPTAKNNQGSKFVIVKDDVAGLKKLVWDGIDELLSVGYKDVPKELLPFVLFNKQRKADPANDYLFKNAPVVVFVTSDWPLDAGLAAENMELMAASLGLGALYNGYLARMCEQLPEVKKWLGVEETTIRACLLFGYSAVSYRRTVPRKPANTIWR